MRRTSPSFFNHWRAKIASLLLATVLWLIIKHGIAYAPALPATNAPAPTATPGPSASRA